MLVGIEVAQAGDDVTGQADADDFQDCAEDEKRQIVEGGMRVDGVLFLEDGEGRGRRHGGGIPGLAGASHGEPQGHGRPDVEETHQMPALVSLLSVWLLLLLLPCDLGDGPKLDGCLMLQLRCNRQCRGVLGCTDAVDGRRLRQTQGGWVEQAPGSRLAHSSLVGDCRFDAEDLKKEQRAVDSWRCPQTRAFA